MNQVSNCLSFAAGFGVVPVRNPDLFQAPIRISISCDHNGKFVSSKMISGEKEVLSWTVIRDSRGIIEDEESFSLIIAEK